LDWWVQAVLDHFNMLLPEFIDSPEFQHLVPDCQDLGAVTLLVGRLYQQVLKRVPSWDEVVWWTADIVTWCALQDAVEFFFNSLEYLSVPRTLADHVTVLYRGLLAREPDAGGLAWWMDDLAGQLTTPEDAVMASPEFEAHVYRLFPSPDVAYRRLMDPRGPPMDVQRHGGRSPCRRPIDRSVTNGQGHMGGACLKVRTRSGPFSGESLPYLDMANRRGKLPGTESGWCSIGFKAVCDVGAI
jgi:hypothetical protein